MKLAVVPNDINNLENNLAINRDFPDIFSKTSTPFLRAKRKFNSTYILL